VFKPSWCAVPFRRFRLDPHNPVCSCLNHTFAFLSPLFAQAIPQEVSWSLLVPSELDCSPACTLEEAVTATAPSSCVAESRDCRVRSTLLASRSVPAAGICQPSDILSPPAYVYTYTLLGFEKSSTCIRFISRSADWPGLPTISSSSASQGLASRAVPAAGICQPSDILSLPRFEKSSTCIRFVHIA